VKSNDLRSDLFNGQTFGSWFDVMYRSIYHEDNARKTIFTFSFSMTLTFNL